MDVYILCCVYYLSRQYRRAVQRLTESNLLHPQRLPTTLSAIATTHSAATTSSSSSSSSSSGSSKAAWRQALATPSFTTAAISAPHLSSTELGWACQYLAAQCLAEVRQWEEVVSVVSAGVKEEWLEKSGEGDEEEGEAGASIPPPSSSSASASAMKTEDEDEKQVLQAHARGTALPPRPALHTPAPSASTRPPATPSTAAAAPPATSKAQQLTALLMQQTQTQPSAALLSPAPTASHTPQVASRLPPPHTAASSAAASSHSAAAGSEQEEVAPVFGTKSAPDAPIAVRRTEERME